MATAIAGVTVTRAGVAPATLTTGTADLALADNDGNVLVEVQNGSGGNLTVTFVTTSSVAGIALEDVTVVVPGGQTRWVGPLPPAIFNQADDSVSVQAVGLNLRALRL